MSESPEGAQVDEIIQPGEDLRPNEQAEIDRESIEAKSRLEKEIDGIKFVQDIIRLPIKHSDQKPGEAVDLVTVEVQNPDEERLKLIKSFLGTKENPDMIFPEEGGKEKDGDYIYIGRSTELDGRFLRVKMRKNNITEAEIGYPAKNINR